MVVVDTCAWFALFVPSDPDHRRLRDWFAANQEPIFTTDFCIDETLPLLRVRGEAARAVARVHFVSPEHVHRAWIVFQQRVAAGWSFTDCTSSVVMSDLRIPKAAALDVHFRQFGVVVVP